MKKLKKLITLMHQVKVPYFTIPMGILGLAVSFNFLEFHYPWLNSLTLLMMFWGSVVLGLIVIANLITNEQPLISCMNQQWDQAHFSSVFPSITLTLLLMTMGISLVLKWQIFWVFSLLATLHFLLFYFLVIRWMWRDEIAFADLNPTWFIVLSGNFIVVNVAYETLILSDSPLLYEILWGFFASALLFWFVLVFNLFLRLFFHAPLPPSLVPVLFIFMAPPSLAVIAGLHLMPSLNLLIMAMFGFAWVVFIVWMLNLKRFIQSGFSLNAWAYIYPLAAFASANLAVAEQIQADHIAEALQRFSLILSLLTLFVMVLLSVYSIKNIIRYYQDL